VVKCRYDLRELNDPKRQKMLRFVAICWDFTPSLQKQILNQECRILHVEAWGFSLCNGRCRQKKGTPVGMPSIYFSGKNYFKPATLLAKPDFRLAALFWWI